MEIPTIYHTLNSIALIIFDFEFMLVSLSFFSRENEKGFVYFPRPCSPCASSRGSRGRSSPRAAGPRCTTTRASATPLWQVFEYSNKVRFFVGKWLFLSDGDKNLITGVGKTHALNFAIDVGGKFSLEAVMVRILLTKIHNFFERGENFVPILSNEYARNHLSIFI